MSVVVLCGRSYGVTSLRGRGLVSLLFAGLLLAGCAAGSSDSRHAAMGPGAGGTQLALAVAGPVEPSQRHQAFLAQADEDDDFDEDALFGTSSSGGTGDGDPLETLNRFTFAFNDMLDTLFLRPVAFTYRELLPLGVRNAVQSFLRNLATPIILVNDLLQGDGDRALITAKRFFVNTAFSLGFYDYASQHGLPYNDADFGQTLGTYGAGEGFYLVLPVLGPSSLRDATGRVVDQFLDPLTYVVTGSDGTTLSITQGVLGGVDARSRNIELLDEARADSLDYYVRVRSLWRQLRQEEIRKRSDGTAPRPSL